MGKFTKRNMPIFNALNFFCIYSISRKGHQIVALKIIDLEKTEDDIEDLLAEVDFQAKCDSPYLAKYLGT